MAFPDDPCPWCPRTERGLPPPCLAQVQRNPRLCELVRAGHEDYRDHLLKDGGQVSPTPAPDPPSPSEAAILRSLFCPFQRYAGCSCGKPYECGVDGTLKTAAQCRGCLFGYVWPT
jgi:hypothetical protein